MIQRTLKIDLPARQSAFLWGPRKTGKSTYLKDCFPDGFYIDFLKTDILFEYMKAPSLLRERLNAGENDPRLKKPVILDEVQKIPGILDEVHWLIENKRLHFILCGSSACKLKRDHANLLGGRAWRFEMFPLTYGEIKDFDLLTALNAGLVPSHYLSPNPKRSLQSYIHDYLNEEIRAEGLTRNIPAFARFLDAIGYSNGELINYANIARDCGVDAKTVREYFLILEDTLLGRSVMPFSKTKNRQLITRSPKFYLFDVGVAGTLAKRTVGEEKGASFGAAFEHFIIMELFAHRSYSEKDHDIRFWRTSTGLEVDFVLGQGEVAIEVKGTSRVDSTDFRGLKAFHEDYHPRQSIVVCNEKEPRKTGFIDVMPWKYFLEKLYAGKIL
jgi:uncharacterized protein